jgi:AraC family transcriptional regulator
MDWLQGMNEVVDHIEDNLTCDIPLASLAKILGCSTYEFSRVFSFIAGISVSEYIRRRRLSQAVFDIQQGKESIIDIALKYRYESQSAFTRAFKELHGHTPAASRKTGISFKTYPKITFRLVIKGIVEMDFKIESKDSFKIIGYKCSGEWDDWVYFNQHLDPQLRSNITENSYYKAPFWQVGAYKFNPSDEASNKNCSKNEYQCIIGAQLKEEPILSGMDVEEFPAATWAIFSVEYDPLNDSTGKTYAKVLSEWFPVSNYKRNDSIPYLEVYSIPGEAEPNRYHCEIWVPVVNK